MEFEKDTLSLKPKELLYDNESFVKGTLQEIRNLLENFRNESGTEVIAVENKIGRRRVYGYSSLSSYYESFEELNKQLRSRVDIVLTSSNYIPEVQALSVIEKCRLFTTFEGHQYYDQYSRLEFKWIITFLYLAKYLINYLNTFSILKFGEHRKFKVSKDLEVFLRFLTEVDQFMLYCIQECTKVSYRWERFIDIKAPKLDNIYLAIREVLNLSIFANFTVVQNGELSMVSSEEDKGKITQCHQTGALSKIEE